MYGTRPKLTVVDRICGSTSAARKLKSARSNNQVLIDFSTHSKIKKDMMTRMVKSSVKEQAKKMGLPQDFIERTKGTEIPLSEVNSAIKDNKNFRQEIFETFKRQGESAVQYLKSMRDDYEEEATGIDPDEQRWQQNEHKVEGIPS